MLVSHRRNKILGTVSESLEFQGALGDACPLRHDLNPKLGICSDTGQLLDLNLDLAGLCRRNTIIYSDSLSCARAQPRFLGCAKSNMTACNAAPSHRFFTGPGSSRNRLRMVSTLDGPTLWPGRPAHNAARQQRGSYTFHLCRRNDRPLSSETVCRRICCWAWGRLEKRFFAAPAIFPTTSSNDRPYSRPCNMRTEKSPCPSGQRVTKRKRPPPFSTGNRQGIQHGCVQSLEASLPRQSAIHKFELSLSSTPAGRTPSVVLMMALMVACTHPPRLRASPVRDRRLYVCAYSALPSLDRARRVQGLRRTLELCRESRVRCCCSCESSPPDAFLFVGLITNSLQTGFSDLAHRVAGKGLLRA